jgi:hypothetical protein
MVAAIKLFLVCPATFDMPTVMMRLELYVSKHALASTSL